MIEFIRIEYSSLNARQKENYNFHKVAGSLAEYGYNSMRLNDDWQGADFIAIKDNEMMKIQLKGRFTIDKKYIDQIIKVSEICLDAKADFIKTSTGFSKSGATLAAVKIIKKTVRDKARIQASGGIVDFDTALKYIDVRADRIGTSKLIKNKNNKRQIRNTKVYKAYTETILH